MGGDDQAKYFTKWELKRCNGWYLTFCILPRQCTLSGKRIWFKSAYKGKCVINGPGSDVIITHYLDRFEFMKWKLQG